MRQATLHQLKVFETAARLTSITRAAAELSLTQPTVSMQIKQLTKTIGMPLFEQVGKRLFLTEAGKELYATCRTIFTSLDEFEGKIADFQGMSCGQLRIATITTTKYFLPRALAPFCKKYPGINVELQIINHEQIVERLLANLDDLYIISHLPEEVDLVSAAFLDNPLVVIAPNNHPLADEKDIPIETLQGEKFIMREKGSGTRMAVEKLFRKHDVSVKVKLELAANEAIKQAIKVGFGISVLSRHTFTSESIAMGLKILDVQHFPISRQWYVAYPQGKQLSIVASTFLDFLKAEAPQIASTLTQDWTIV
jgi:LysR family transcriptional regulator, low CO2-responsive transcriptional regulator